MSGLRGSKMDCESVRADLGAYALGALDTADAKAVEAHLAQCGDCTAQFVEYQNALDRLGTLIPPVQPPAGLHDRLMAAATESAVGVEVAVQPMPETEPGFWTRRHLLSLAAVACLFILAIGILRAVLNDDEQPPEIADSSQTLAAYVAGGGVSIPMEAQPKAVEWWPNGAGSLMVSEGKPPLVVMSGCPPSSDYRDYKVWLALDGERTGVGSIDVNEQGIGVLVLPDGSLAGDYDQIGVTMVNDEGERTDLMIRSLDDLPQVG